LRQAQVRRVTPLVPAQKQQRKHRPAGTHLGPTPAPEPPANGAPARPAALPVVLRQFIVAMGGGERKGGREREKHFIYHHEISV
jgi:hypothetical protein